MSEASKPSQPVLRQRSSAGWLRFMDLMVQGTATGGALLMIGLLVMLLIVVGIGAWPAMHKLGLAFIWHNRWSSVHADFGAWPLIYGTLVTAAIGMAISIPVSLGSAIFLTKLAPKVRLRNKLVNLIIAAIAALLITSLFTAIALSSGLHPLFALLAALLTLPVAFGLVYLALPHFVLVTSFLIELLAAIPSIAYGLWGVFVLVPLMQNTVQPIMADTLAHIPLIGSFFSNTGIGLNILTAGIILSIMVTPIMTAIIRDVLSVAPPELEQGALGLGATWWQATRLVLGFSKMGILGAVILGFARAIGETMAVTMVIGNSIDMDNTVTSPGYTIASILANQFNNADTDAEKHALVYAAFVLLVITTLINGIARVMVMRVAAKGKRR
jgi:phosphate transport system permease protein